MPNGAAIISASTKRNTNTGASLFLQANLPMAGSIQGWVWINPLSDHKRARPLAGILAGSTGPASMVTWHHRGTEWSVAVRQHSAIAEVTRIYADRSEEGQCCVTLLNRDEMLRGAPFGTPRS